MAPNTLYTVHCMGDMSNYDLVGHYVLIKEATLSSMAKSYATAIVAELNSSIYYFFLFNLPH
jgi:hypothetical protein